MARSDAIKMDFLTGIARIAGERLTAGGYAIDPNEPPTATLRKYLNVQMRRVTPAKRVTHKARAFTCPPDHQAGLDLLTKKAKPALTYGHIKAHPSITRTSTTPCCKIGIYAIDEFASYELRLKTRTLETL